MKLIKEKKRIILIIIFIIILVLSSTLIILKVINNYKLSKAQDKMIIIKDEIKQRYYKNEINKNIYETGDMFVCYKGECINEVGNLLNITSESISNGIITLYQDHVTYEMMTIDGYSCNVLNDEVICEKYKPIKTKAKIKNVIFMIGDGMGENHILSGEIYNEEKLNMQKIENSTYVLTTSLSYPSATDSAAAATALATGVKTMNSRIGKDAENNKIETNIIDYASKYDLKTGLVCTQRLSNATPAAFATYATTRMQERLIATRMVTESNVDLMLGGGSYDFDALLTEIKESGFVYFKDFKTIKYCTENASDSNCFAIDEKLIGAFAPTSITYRDKPIYSTRPSLKDMSEVALKRLESNSNGFFVMIEGSDIDRYSETTIDSNGVETKRNLKYMLEELNDFDEAVGLAMEYVDNNPNTLLIVTADHETGNLNLSNINTKEELIKAGNSVFQVGRNHTNKKVLLYAYGEGANDITKDSVINNTDIYGFLTQGLDNYHKNN